MKIKRFFFSSFAMYFILYILFVCCKLYIYRLWYVSILWQIIYKNNVECLKQFGWNLLTFHSIKKKIQTVKELRYSELGKQYR